MGVFHVFKIVQVLPNREKHLKYNFKGARERIGQAKYKIFSKNFLWEALFVLNRKFLCGLKNPGIFKSRIWIMNHKRSIIQRKKIITYAHLILNVLSNQNIRHKDFRISFR